MLELSIVLVIIGLLAGGIIVGQSMIRTAEIRSTLSKMKEAVAQIGTFRLKFSALPGDFADAKNHWPDNSQFAGFSTGNGNGNGMISENLSNGMTSCSSCERLWVWQHLALANMLPGNFSGQGAGSSGVDLIPGANVPEVAIANAGLDFLWHTADAYPIPGGAANLLKVGGRLDQNLASAIFTASEAYALDMKMDDGAPGRGKIISMRAWAAPSLCVVTDNDPSTTYVIGDAGMACRSDFLVQ